MYKNGWKLGKGSGNELVGEKEVTEYLNKLTDLKNAPAYEVQEELGDYYENLGDVTGEPQWKRLVTNSVWSTDLVASYNNYKKLILSGSSEDHQLVDQLLGQKAANWEEIPQLNNYAEAKSEFDQALKDAEISFETHIT
ncbi:hypothetical protein ACTID9_25370 [Brevibacillus fluminis]|uniref:hypothetical protein n=1 Tax=Brevibacillus fluminis TaxID=511487 RepID=UPI003F8ACE9E